MRERSAVQRVRADVRWSAGGRERGRPGQRWADRSAHPRSTSRSVIITLRCVTRRRRAGSAHASARGALPAAAPPAQPVQLRGHPRPGPPGRDRRRRPGLVRAAACPHRGRRQRRERHAVVVPVPGQDSAAAVERGPERWPARLGDRHRPAAMDPAASHLQPASAARDHGGVLVEPAARAGAGTEVLALAPRLRRRAADPRARELRGHAARLRSAPGDDLLPGQRDLDGRQRQREPRPRAAGAAHRRHRGRVQRDRGPRQRIHPHRLQVRQVPQLGGQLLQRRPLAGQGAGARVRRSERGTATGAR